MGWGPQLVVLLNHANFKVFTEHFQCWSTLSLFKIYRKTLLHFSESRIKPILNTSETPPLKLTSAPGFPGHAILNIHEPGGPQELPVSEKLLLFTIWTATSLALANNSKTDWLQNACYLAQLSKTINPMETNKKSVPLWQLLLQCNAIQHNRIVLCLL